MNEEKLSKRLETVARFVPNEARIADIGSDHAYLPCYLLLSGKASFAIAGEIALGPFHSAEKQVQKTGLTKMINVRKGDGLTVIHSEDALDTIIIAGMGGTLIRSILEKKPERLDGIDRLVLQPNIGAHKLREWAENNFFQLISEAILREDNKVYEILVFKRSNKAVTYNEKERLFGPFLMQENSAVFQAKWHHEKSNWQQILANIQSAKKYTPENEARMKELTHKIQLAEEVLR